MILGYTYPFGENMEIFMDYDGIFLCGIDKTTRVLYLYEEGDSNRNIPFRYWAIDFSKNFDLLCKVIYGEELLYDVVVKGKIPAKIVKVVDFEYGKNFANYLQDEDVHYIPNMISKELYFNDNCLFGNAPKQYIEEVKEEIKSAHDILDDIITRGVLESVSQYPELRNAKLATSPMLPGFSSGAISDEEFEEFKHAIED